MKKIALAKNILTPPDIIDNIVSERNPDRMMDNAIITRPDITDKQAQQYLSNVSRTNRICRV